MLVKCKFEGCNYMPNDSTYCPRHEVLVKHAGSEDALMDEVFGKACSMCGERELGVDLEYCPDCGADDVCPECINAEACCMGIFDEDDDDEFEDDDDDC